MLLPVYHLQISFCYNFESFEVFLELNLTNTNTAQKIPFVKTLFQASHVFSIFSNIAK